LGQDDFTSVIDLNNSCTKMGPHIYSVNNTTKENKADSFYARENLH